MEVGSGCRVTPLSFTTAAPPDLIVSYQSTMCSGQSCYRSCPLGVRHDAHVTLLFTCVPFVYSSDVQAKDLQLQVEQTLSKDETAYTAMRETTRPSKPRTNRTKNRRSPYPHISHTEYNSSTPSTDYLEKTPAAATASYDYSSDISLALQSGYSGLMYPSAQESMERYGALYSSAYAHPGIYGTDRTAAMSMYPYGTSTSGYFDDRSYRSSSYDESKYFSCRDTNSLYPGYVTTGTQSHDLRTVSAESRDSYRHSDSSGTAVNGSSSSQCEYSQHTPGGSTGTAHCRSSSSTREATYGVPSHHPSSYSSLYTRPESASDNDITSEEFDKRRSGRQSGSTYDTLVDATRLSHDEAKSSFKSSCRESSSHATTTTSGQSGTTSTPNGDVSSIQQSVIMRRHSNTTTEAPPSSNGLTDISDNTTSSHQELKQTTGSTTSLSSLEPAVGGLDSRTKSLTAMDNSSLYAATANSHCTYDTSSAGAYGKHGYPGSALQGGRPYPLVPQAGYTSVIVDTQQYHMANGYVH